MDTATAHLAHCRDCWELAARAVAELQREGALGRFSDARKAVLTLLEKEETLALNRLLAHSRWAELRNLSPEEQIQRIKASEAFQTQEMFATVIAAATSAALEDPHVGEETAHVAHALASSLPKSRFSEAQRNDFQGKALVVSANSRRLAAEWAGASAALDSARRHFERGTGEPQLEAQRLRIEASLAADIGKPEAALEFLSRAATAYQRAQHTAALAQVLVQEAGTLLASSRYEEAIARAEEALRFLSPRDARLELLARSIITECFAWLDRPAEALHCFVVTWPLYEQFAGYRNQLRWTNLEAILLDVMNHARDAEKAYRRAIAGYMEGELYKDAFLTVLTLFESFFRRGAWDKAAQTCQEALQMVERAGGGCHAQIGELWRDLLELVRARQLTEIQVLAARQFLMRNWHTAAPLAARLGGAVPAASRGPQAVARRVEDGTMALATAYAAPATQPSPPPASHEEALARHDHQLVALALAQCGGSAREAARLLRISRNTLKVKIKKYGLDLEDLILPAKAQEGSPGAREEERQVLNRLRAQSRWAELRELPPERRIERLQSAAMLRTREMFDTLIKAASSAALENPELGREIALAALTLAGLLPTSLCTNSMRHDLQSEALLVVANCRRLAADWEESGAALERARHHLDRGTGDPARKARLLSIEASLASETGDLGLALNCLACAAAIYRRSHDATALASITVQEAGTFLAAYRHEEAISRADEALRLLPPREARLELLARSIITECLAFLGRSTEALRSLLATWPLYEQFRGHRNDLRLGNLEAYVLDALGHLSEAEAAFRGCIEGYLEAELYKDAFLTLLARFESLFRRGSLDKAARACEEALEAIEQAGAVCHDQMSGMWRDLLELAEGRLLTDRHLLAARHYVVRYWSASSQAGGSSVSGWPRWDANGTTAPMGAKVEAPGAEAATVTAGETEGRRFLRVDPPPAVSHLAPGEYQAALEGYESQIIAAGLEQCQGRLKETAGLLGISLNTLKVKMVKFGLRGAA